MPDYNKLTALAEACGFTNCAPLDISTLEFMQEVRDMCNPNQCDRYGKSWSCPPECPPLDVLQQRVLGYSGGFLVQTVGELEDSYDWEGIITIGLTHKANFGKMWEALEKQYSQVYAMGAGACMLCETCTYPDEPCRHPERMSASMEASGLLVNKVCTDNNLGYNYGQDKIAFTACFLFNE
jgi:predicted metal-binding protein